MSDYSRLVDYAAKDSLSSGNPLKAVTGTELGAEFSAIATSSATKADKTMTAPFLLASGSVSAPGLGFSSETNTGIYRVGAGQFAITIGGTQAIVSSSSRNWTINAAASGATLTLAGGTNTALNLASGALQIAGSAGTSGYVFTSGGAGASPAWVATTGSGNFVRATSPTFVTPVLGTPTSGNLANCTFPTLNQDTTGAAGSVSNTGAVSTAATFYLPFLSANTSTNQALNTAAALSFNPSTGALSATSFTGAGTGLTGTAASLTAGTASAVAVGGITGLGTGVATFLATPSSANLAAAVTGETGSGALVFATSPTLVTPALGTPSSGTLTSCTGLPLTTGITGTLAVGHGGTGITSTPTNGQIPIGNGSTYAAATLTAGAGIAITNGSGSITIAASSSGAGSVQLASKAADTIRASTTTPANDPDLTAALTAGRYIVELYVRLGVPTSGADGFVWNLNYSGTFTAQTYQFAYDGLVNGSAIGLTQLLILSSVAGALVPYAAITASAGSDSNFIKIVGEIIATGSGTLGFSWAQNTSGAHNTAVCKGSWMRVTQVA